ncbi:MAG: QueT transporter family protein [Clostridia bacterium]|nr:QueT transporter family protein [Clostridia bacterium]
MKKQTNATRLARGAMIGAIYVALTFIANAFGLASGAIQVRLSEALCVLPAFFPEAVPGLWLGCFLANLLTGCAPMDILFGSIATLIGAYGTMKFKDHSYLLYLPPVLSNAIIVPIVLKLTYGLGDAWWYLVATVAIGEIISCVILGSILSKIIKRHNLK